MTRALLLAVALLALAVSGCDAVVENPVTDPQPPSVSFTTATLASANLVYHRDRDELGSVRGVTIPAGSAPTLITVIARLPTQIHHPSTGLGEDVTVHYELSGDAQLGVDFDLYFPQRNADTREIVVEGGAIQYGPNPHPVGRFLMPYLLQPVDPANRGGHIERVQFRILPGARPGRTIVFELVNATAPSNQPIEVGRLPGMRDRKLTIGIGEALTGIGLAWQTGGELQPCPAQVNVGRSVVFNATALQAAPPVAFSWDFGGGASPNTHTSAMPSTGAPSSVSRVFTTPGTYTVTLSATQGASAGVEAGATATATCQVTVIP
jgi:hypothetical protein